MILNAMLTGALACASGLVALFFLRFWRTTGDRFFLFFAVSFALEGANRAALGLRVGAGEEQPAYYLVRLVAYALILIAIIDKNRPRPPRG
jgi:hypothetical protein